MLTKTLLSVFVEYVLGDEMFISLSHLMAVAEQRNLVEEADRLEEPHLQEDEHQPVCAASSKPGQTCPAERQVRGSRS